MLSPLLHHSLRHSLARSAGGHAISLFRSVLNLDLVDLSALLIRIFQYSQRALVTLRGLVAGPTAFVAAAGLAELGAQLVGKRRHVLELLRKLVLRQVDLTCIAASA